MKEITKTRYVIEFDPKMDGWLAFKVVTSRGAILEKIPVVTAKPIPHLAARSLARVLSRGFHLPNEFCRDKP